MKYLFCIFRELFRFLYETPRFFRKTAPQLSVLQQNCEFRFFSSKALAFLFSMCYNYPDMNRQFGRPFPTRGRFDFLWEIHGESPKKVQKQGANKWNVFLS